MIIGLDDWPKLRRVCLATLAVVGAAVLLSWYTQVRLGQARQQLQDRLNTKARIEQEIGRERDAARHLETWQKTFLTLEQDGIVGPARRTEWIDILQDIQRDLDIPAMRYEFAPEHALTPGSRWFASPLQLQMTIRHELDLLRGLERLQAQGRALILVRDCKLAPSLPTPEAGLAQLNASCRLDLLNLHREEHPQ